MADHSENKATHQGVVPEPQRPGAQRILDRVRQCSPTTQASAKLFTERICETILSSPYATADDALGARAVLAALHANPAAIEGVLADPQSELFPEGGA